MPDLEIRMGPDAISQAELEDFLKQCDEAFVPPLSSRVNVHDYSVKLALHANFVVAVEDPPGRTIGVAAFYDNDGARQVAFLSSLSVLPGRQGRGIARSLIDSMIRIVVDKGFRGLRLEVEAGNERAVSLYHSLGFRRESNNASGAISMELALPAPRARNA